MIDKTVDYLVVFFAALLPTLAIVPAVRALLKRAGMVDMPGERRINKTPVPRGGGIALVLGTLVPYAVFVALSGRPAMQGVDDLTMVKMAVLSVAIALVGFLDDRFSLSPKVKLAGQVAVAFAVWRWAGIGFSELWPHLPPAGDMVLTVLWIVGAVNAFNLIDGLDGLAAGVAFIAAVGMAGGSFLLHNPQQSLFYFAFAGALLGFLRYNYNPASIFLGDTGSMFIGFVVSTLPMLSQDSNSVLVSVGMPLLAMGVPIFDTSLAILRRILRRLFNRGGAAGRVMAADKDHLHHRLLRACNLNQRRVAWILYVLAVFGVSVGLAAMFLESRTAGLWLFAVAVASVVIFRDMSKVELYETGRFLNAVVHRRETETVLHNSRLTVPFYILSDGLLLVALYFACKAMLSMPLTMMRRELLIYSVSTFFALAVFKTYATVWSRASTWCYLRLFAGVAAGSSAAFIVLYYLTPEGVENYGTLSFVYAFGACVLLGGLRFLRSAARDVFYMIDCARMKRSENVSRVLVYGGGIRYQAFRRELVRRAYSGGRMIVGIVDDNPSLAGKYIGEVKVYGGIDGIEATVKELRADAVVVACAPDDEVVSRLGATLRPMGVKLTVFGFSEREARA